MMILFSLYPNKQVANKGTDSNLHNDHGFSLMVYCLSPLQNAGLPNYVKYSWVESKTRTNSIVFSKTDPDGAQHVQMMLNLLDIMRRPITKIVLSTAQAAIYQINK